MTIGTYRLLEMLGQGGMGTVWRAEHTLLGRHAAVKVLLPSLSASPELVQRFFNEARAVTAIGDPGIVQIFDFGIHVDGSAYIVMELLGGESIEARISRLGSIAPLDAARLVRQVALSLEAAHGKHVVHRDLKPENVVVVPDPAVSGGERTKVLDFGIAKLGSVDNKLKTQTGAWLGTPVYMSPEQCRSVAEVDHRSDIYSLGCMLFCMLTGRPPFDRSSSADVVIAHVRDVPPRVSTLVPVPPALDALVARCLAKDPAQRYTSMQEVASALGSIEATLQRPSAPSYPVASPLERTLAVRPPNPTTLSRANGHIEELQPTPRRWPKSLALVATALIAMILIGIGVGFATSDAPTPAASGPTQPPVVVEPAVAPAPVEPAPASTPRTAASYTGEAAPPAPPPPPPPPEAPPAVQTSAPAPAAVEAPAPRVKTITKKAPKKRAKRLKKEPSSGDDTASPQRDVGIMDRRD